LELAVLFARVQGGVHLLLAFLAALALINQYDGNLVAIGLMAIGAIVFPFMFVPGVLYLLFASFMGRRKRWAVISVLVLACVHASITAGWPLLILATGCMASPFQLLVTGMLLIVACLLIVYCVQSLPAVRPPSDHSSGPRGFEVTMAGGPLTSFPTPPQSLKERTRG
jgi:hypothetical protein